ncbi:hypothetical protein Tco_0044319 [Tanacetum coccineum]
MQSSSVSSDFTEKLLNFENVSSADNEIASLMDTTVCHEEPSGQTSTFFTVPITVILTNIPPPPHFFNPLPQQTTPTPTPTASEVTTAFPALPDFSSVFKFKDRVTKLETDLSEMKQVDQYAQAISFIPAIVDHYINNKLGEAIHKAIQSHNAECREEAQVEKHEYIDLVDSSVRTIIREEVKTQLPQILPKVVLDFATPIIERNVTDSLEADVLAKYSSQPKFTYEAAASLSEYELTKILLDKIEESKSHLRADYKRELYDALVKSYNTDKDLFETYGEVFMLKRGRDEKDKDQDPSARSDRGTKRRKLSKYAESSRDPKSKESKSTSSSKGTSRSQHKSSGKSTHVEEPSHTVGDSGVQQNQEFDTGNNDEQLDDEAASKRKHVDFRPPQTWISNIARKENPPTSFNELMDTPIDFSAFVMNRLKITNLTQELLVGPTFNLLKGTCKSRTELEYHFEECFKATTERLDWHNPEGKQYPFDLRKPLPLIPKHRGRHVIPFDYFINNDLEYLKGGSLSRRYSTSVTKTKATTYEVQWIEDMVPNIWSPVKDVYYRKRIIAVTRLMIMKMYDYGHLYEIEVRKEDQQLYMFKEGDFPRLRLQDIEDKLLLLVQQKLTNLTIEGHFDLNVALHIFRLNLRNKTAYTAYSDPQGVIYKDQNNINRLMRTDELHKFSDGTLNDVWTALHDITSGIRMEYLPKW